MYYFFKKIFYYGQCALFFPIKDAIDFAPVFVDLPEIDDEIDSGDEFGSVESVKAVSSLFMPVSGRIKAVNTELKDSPELINEECYDDGWMIRLELINPEESADLLSAQEYEEFLVEEE